MSKSQGFRANTRSLLRKKPRERGKLSVTKLLRQFNIGDKVIVKIDSAVHKGMPHRRYHGKVGIVQKRRGRAYIVHVPIGKSIKEIIVRPEHLEPYVG